MDQHQEGAARVVESRVAGDVSVVELVGCHDVDSATHVQLALSRGLEAGGGLIVDLSQSHLVDSVVLGHIITAHQRGCERGTPVGIVTDERTPPVVSNLLRISGVGRTIGVYPAVREARRALVGGGELRRGA
jgi:anti-anti-sigma regulatory factor